MSSVAGHGDTSIFRLPMSKVTGQTGKYGSYTVPRKCEKCEFTTSDREAYWAHVIERHEKKAAS